MKILFRHLGKRHFLLFAAILAAGMIVSFTIGAEILNGVKPTMLSFAIIHFVGYLWFLLMPVEALMAWFIAQGGNPLAVFLVAIGTAIPALLIDYAFGLLVPQRAIEDLMGVHRSGKYNRYLDQYGKYVILFFAATPLSSPLLTLVAGMARYPFWQLFAYTAVGLAFKYAMIALVASLI